MVPSMSQLLTLKNEGFWKNFSEYIKKTALFSSSIFCIKDCTWRKSQLVIEGQHVIPQILIDEGYSFHFPNLESALRDIYK